MTCRCEAPPFSHTDFESRQVGVDESAGRFADVSLERCKACGQQWLRYFFEFEAFSRSGRWFRVPISNAESASITAATALAFMARSPWYFRGGSYFDTAGERCEGQLDPRFV